MSTQTEHDDPAPDAGSATTEAADLTLAIAIAAPSMSRAYRRYAALWAERTEAEGWQITKR